MKRMLTTLKNFIFSTSDYWDFKLGAIFLALSALPYLGVVVQILAVLTGILLTLKAGIGLWTDYLSHKQKKYEYKKSVKDIKTNP